jgi:Ca2+/H+ antiporter
MLVVVTLLVALCSEYLTGAIDSMSGTLTESFIGVLYMCSCLPLLIMVHIFALRLACARARGSRGVNILIGTQMIDIYVCLVDSNC